MGDDPRVEAALDWQARAVTGAGGMTYLKSGRVGPCFACGHNRNQPCAWGGQ